MDNLLKVQFIMFTSTYYSTITNQLQKGYKEMTEYFEIMTKMTNT